MCVKFRALFYNRNIYFSFHGKHENVLISDGII